MSKVFEHEMSQIAEESGCNWIYDNKSVKQAARIIADSNAKHDKTLKEISEAEIKSKDRVDISLAEYDRLRKENENLRQRVDEMEGVLVRMGIPADAINNIDSDSITVFKNNDWLGFKTRYQIIFTTDYMPKY